MDLRKRPSESFMMLALWRREFFAAMAQGVFKGKVCDGAWKPFRVMILRLSTTPGNDFVLEAGVQIFGVFPDEHDVHVFQSATATPGRS